MGDVHSALVCAMPMELRPLVRKLGLRRSTTSGGLSVATGSSRGRNVVATATGMGTALARASTRQLLDTFSVDRVIVFGVTGATHADTPIGTVVRPEAVIDEASGAVFLPDDRGAGTTSGTIVTTDKLTTDPDELEKLRNDGVVSLDMETATIAGECAGRSIPWCAFRVVSDRATDDDVDEAVFHLSRQDGSARPWAVAGYCVRHPLRLPALARLAKGFMLATDRAASEAIAALDASG